MQRAVLTEPEERIPKTVIASSQLLLFFDVHYSKKAVRSRSSLLLAAQCRDSAVCEIDTIGQNANDEVVESVR